MANLFTRSDTFFGICEALGQDLGFNPIFLRVALAVMLLCQPIAVIVGYFAVGAVVLTLRLLMPDATQQGLSEVTLGERANDADSTALAEAA